MYVFDFSGIISSTFSVIYGLLTDDFFTTYTGLHGNNFMSSSALGIAVAVMVKIGIEGNFDLNP